MRLTCSEGDEVVCVVRKTRPYSATKSNSIAATVAKLRKGDVRRAVIVRTRKEIARPDGRVIAFGDNAGVLLNAKKEMIGTRVNGVIAQEVRNAGWTKIAALATKVCRPRRLPPSSP